MSLCAWAEIPQVVLAKTGQVDIARRLNFV